MMTKKELPMGQCSFFLDPKERSAPRARKKMRDVGIVSAEVLESQYQSQCVVTSTADDPL